MENFKPETEGSKLERHAYNVLHLLKEVEKNESALTALEDAFNREGLSEVSHFAGMETAYLADIISESSLGEAREKLAEFLETEDEKKKRELAAEIALLFV